VPKEKKEEMHFIKRLPGRQERKEINLISWSSVHNGIFR
jgi:hypothetical protein